MATAAAVALDKKEPVDRNCLLCTTDIDPPNYAALVQAWGRFWLAGDLGKNVGQPWNLNSFVCRRRTSWNDWLQVCGNWKPNETLDDIQPDQWSLNGLAFAASAVDANAGRASLAGVMKEIMAQRYEVVLPPSPSRQRHQWMHIRQQQFAHVPATEWLCEPNTPFAPLPEAAWNAAILAVASDDHTDNKDHPNQSVDWSQVQLHYAEGMGTVACSHNRPHLWHNRCLQKQVEEITPSLGVDKFWNQMHYARSKPGAFANLPDPLCMHRHGAARLALRTDRTCLKKSFHDHPSPRWPASAGRRRLQGWEGLETGSLVWCYGLTYPYTAHGGCLCQLLAPDDPSVRAARQAAPKARTFQRDPLGDWIVDPSTGQPREFAEHETWSSHLAVRIVVPRRYEREVFLVPSSSVFDVLRLEWDLLPEWFFHHDPHFYAANSDRVGGVKRITFNPVGNQQQVRFLDDDGTNDARHWVNWDQKYHDHVFVPNTDLLQSQVPLTVTDVGKLLALRYSNMSQNLRTALQTFQIQSEVQCLSVTNLLGKIFYEVNLMAVPRLQPQMRLGTSSATSAATYEVVFPSRIMRYLMLDVFEAAKTAMAGHTVYAEYPAQKLLLFSPVATGAEMTAQGFLWLGLFQLSAASRAGYVLPSGVLVLWHEFQSVSAWLALLRAAYQILRTDPASANVLLVDPTLLQPQLEDQRNQFVTNTLLVWKHALGDVRVNNWPTWWEDLLAWLPFRLCGSLSSEAWTALAHTAHAKLVRAAKANFKQPPEVKQRQQNGSAQLLVELANAWVGELKSQRAREPKAWPGWQQDLVQHWATWKTPDLQICNAIPPPQVLAPAGWVGAIVDPMYRGEWKTYREACADIERNYCSQKAPRAIDPLTSIILASGSASGPSQANPRAPTSSTPESRHRALAAIGALGPAASASSSIQSMPSMPSPASRTSQTPRRRTSTPRTSAAPAAPVARPIAEPPYDNSTQLALLAADIEALKSSRRPRSRTSFPTPPAAASAEAFTEAVLPQRPQRAMVLMGDDDGHDVRDDDDDDDDDDDVMVIDAPAAGPSRPTRVAIPRLPLGAMSLMSQPQQPPSFSSSFQLEWMTHFQERGIIPAYSAVAVTQALRLVADPTELPSRMSPQRLDEITEFVFDNVLQQHRAT